MKVSEIEIYNFRNYKKEKIKFSDGINIICGDNGMGKTNVLEAVYYFSYGRSFRVVNQEIIKDGEKEAKLKIKFQKGERENDGEIRFLKGKKKEIFLNDIELKKTSQLIGNFICVIFTPDEMNIIKGLPEVRRRFCDSAIMVIRPQYVKELIKYRQILNQKTALLKMKSYHTLSVWNEKLAESGSKIMMMRKAYIERINKKSKILQKKISDGKENLELVYNPSVKIGETFEETKDNFLKKLSECEEKEKENLFCLAGPHRDEINIEINGKSAKNYSSQGQIRTAILCLKLAQTEIIEEETLFSPVLLLDDILSELDKKRREFLISHIKGKQIIISCTDIENYFEEKNIIRIKNGEVVKE